MADIADRAEQLEAEQREDALVALRRQQRATARSAPGDDCEGCGEVIPLARRQALPGVALCMPCQHRREANRCRGLR